VRDRQKSVSEIGVRGLEHRPKNSGKGQLPESKMPVFFILRPGRGRRSYRGEGRYLNLYLKHARPEPVDLTYCVRPRGGIEQAVTSRISKTHCGWIKEKPRDRFWGVAASCDKPWGGRGEKQAKKPNTRGNVPISHSLRRN